ncbi:eCIS core domain-containing protein [Chitinophaga nivalis]|uniref:DUF4157 domain-containing protein n=1 Tax=Chitinophaga nivalis TaxID=2991709 RepID=A0ABT3IIB6_9BACT|nr:DUF4157 domain-containing protein [Chitinophaga nivalis]MCW3466643.1 DUF4157 domain-containing protein [Chitinophaga nivalis]MCW3483666.1 DUF4157 domain-containing protein [Chitinophaga nivalis]
MPSHFPTRSNRAPAHPVTAQRAAFFEPKDTRQLSDNTSESFFQPKPGKTMQAKSSSGTTPTATPAPARPNGTGLPDPLKSGIENMSGLAMDDVQVHYNSDKPAQLQAKAYAQGNDIHIGPGQEQHLPHEAWHVVQQQQGRVSPTIQAKGIAINDQEELEKEADTKGAAAAGYTRQTDNIAAAAPPSPVIQRVPLTKGEVFADQVKWAVIQGAASLVAKDAQADKKSGNEKAESFVEELEAAKLIDLETIKVAVKKKGQGPLFDDKKNALFNLITIDKLIEKDLLMDAVNTVAIVNAKWVIYKTEIKDNNKVRSPYHKQKGYDFTTKIEWEDANDDEQGTGVTASVLAPDHPLGSVPDDTLKTKIAKLSKKAGGYPYIAGHLLNNNLGGPGNDARNLAAIPKDVNSKLSTAIEQEAVERVNKKMEVVFYKVTVEYDEDADAKNITYASVFRIKLGTYKKDTPEKNIGEGKNEHLERIKEYSIYINSPTDYDEEEEGYDSETDRAVKNKTNTPLLLPFDPINNIVLKDTTQMKIEFLAFAVNALQIKKLNTKITGLEADKKSLLKLEVEVALLQKQISLVNQELLAAKEQNVHLQDEIKTLAALPAQLDNYVMKSRELVAVMGAQDGALDARQRKEKKPDLKAKVKIRPSILSDQKYNEAYEKAYNAESSRAAQDNVPDERDLEIERLHNIIAEKDQIIFKLKSMMQVKEIKKAPDPGPDTDESSSDEEKEKKVKDIKVSAKAPVQRNLSAPEFLKQVKGIIQTKHGIQPDKSWTDQSSATRLNLTKYQFLVLKMFADPAFKESNEFTSYFTKSRQYQQYQVHSVNNEVYRGMIEKYLPQ